MFFDEEIIVETYRRNKGLALEFSEFLWFIGIWMLKTENPGTIRAEYFSEHPIDIFVRHSIFMNQFMTGNHI